MSLYGAIFRDFLYATANPKSFAWTTAAPSLAMERWICPDCRHGFWHWKSGSSSLVQASRRITRLMNRCIEFIRPRSPRHPQLTPALSNGAPRAGLATTITNGRMRDWISVHPALSTARADELIAGLSPKLTILVIGPHAGSPAAVTSVGAVGCELSVGLLAKTASGSNCLAQVFIKFISYDILLENCTTMIRAACVQLGGSKSQIQNHTVTHVLALNRHPCPRPVPATCATAG